MRIITYFTGTDDPAANRKAVLCGILVVSIFFGIILFGFSPRVTAAESSAGTQNAQALDSSAMQVLNKNEQLAAELEAAYKALDEAQQECDVLRSALEDSDAENTQLRTELETLKATNATSYVLRFRIERNVTFPENSEILYFTRTVDQETYNRWQPGSIILEKTDFLTIPNNGMLHEWVIILDGKYITTNEC